MSGLRYISPADSARIKMKYTKNTAKSDYSYQITAGSAGYVILTVNGTNNFTGTASVLVS